MARDATYCCRPTARSGQSPGTSWHVLLYHAERAGLRAETLEVLRSAHFEAAVIRSYRADLEQVDVAALMAAAAGLEVKDREATTNSLQVTIGDMLLEATNLKDGVRFKLSGPDLALAARGRSRAALRTVLFGRILAGKPRRFPNRLRFSASIRLEDSSFSPAPDFCHGLLAESLLDAMMTAVEPLQ